MLWIINDKQMLLAVFICKISEPSSTPTSHLTPEPTPDPTPEPTPQPTPEPTPKPSSCKERPFYLSDDSQCTNDDAGAHFYGKPY